VALGLTWMGFRAPAVAPELFGAAAAIGAWALIAAGAHRVRGLVGLEPHRRGILVLAGALLVLPVASGHVTNAELVVACALAGAVLGRVGLVRWHGLSGEPGPAAVATMRATPGPLPPPAAAAGAPVVARSTATRVAGRLAGRAGTVLGREAAAGLPRAARAAGRAFGRARRPPPHH
jgi:hypothetical protein